MDYNIHKICRVCLEEGALTSIYSSEFAMAPYTMMMIVSKVRIFKSDGLPAVICNNCIYRLGVAYHFKQECENSDIRLRQYLGLPDRGYGISDAETNTELTNMILNKVSARIENADNKNSDDEDERNRSVTKKSKRRSRYQRKPPEEQKKRGPKPLAKLPHNCYECHKSFKCSTQLQMHMRTHTGEKPFPCRYCSRSFAQKYNLHIHERTHTGFKPFQCEICSKQFSALGNFHAHQKIHSGVRDQICLVCQKGFYSAGDLTKHMVTHTGLKNHHCDICGKSFSRQRDMRAHKRKLHAIQERSEEDEDDENAIDAVNVVATASAVVNDLFRCPDCDKEFISAGGLSVHFRTHSSNNLLSLPLSGGQIQIPPPAPPPATHHPHHPHHHHHYDVLHHSHATHHLQMNPTSLQANPASGMAMLASMHHAPPNASITTPTQNATLSLMHATQRLHPY